MSETRDETTGQFAPSNDGLFGRDLELAEAGFTPMPERLTPEPEEADTASPRAAADELIVSRPNAQPDEVVAYLRADRVLVSVSSSSPPPKTAVACGTPVRTSVRMAELCSSRKMAQVMIRLPR